MLTDAQTIGQQKQMPYHATADADGYEVYVPLFMNPKSGDYDPDGKTDYTTRFPGSYGQKLNEEKKEKRRAHAAILAAHGPALPLPRPIMCIQSTK